MDLPHELVLYIADYLDRHSLERLFACDRELHSTLHGYRQQRYRTELVAHQRAFRTCKQCIDKIEYNTRNNSYSRRFCEGLMVMCIGNSNQTRNIHAHPRHIYIQGEVWGSSEKHADATTNDVWLRTYFYVSEGGAQEMTVLSQCEQFDHAE
jgi:hypothetical protein